MPLGVQGDDGLVGDRLAAALATGGVLVGVALETVGFAFDFHELGADQFRLAVAAHEVILVPVDAHRLEDFLRFSKKKREGLDCLLILVWGG